MEIKVVFHLEDAEDNTPDEGTFVFAWLHEDLHMVEGFFCNCSLGKHIIVDDGNFLDWSEVKFWIPSKEFCNEIKESME